MARPAQYRSWSAEKKALWAKIEQCPGAFTFATDVAGNGDAWTEKEQAHFVKMLREHPPHGNWAYFAMHIPRRLASQCRTFYERLVADGVVKEPKARASKARKAAAKESKDAAAAKEKEKDKDMDDASGDAEDDVENDAEEEEDDDAMASASQEE